MSFDAQVQQAVQTAIIKGVAEGRWIELPYGSVKVEAAALRAIYDKIDMKVVLQRVQDRVETHLADSIYNQMATELGNDAKKILCDRVLRDDIRNIIQERMRRGVEALKGE